VLEYLDETGLAENTVVIYTGDQGMMLGEHDYQDKRWMYEPSQRMPFLVRYPPGIPAGQRSDAIVENVDFAPLMLDFAGVPAPACMQGRSFREICETGQEPDGWKQAAYYRYWMHLAHHWNPSHFGIRTKQYKLIFYYGCDMAGGNRTPPAWELYDLAKDPHELRNVYGDPAYADVVQDLKGRLRDLRRQVGDTDEEFPEIRRIVEEFWEYDAEDRERAVQLSHEYAERQRQRLEARRPRGRSQKPVILPGGWIQPADSDAPLRSHEGCPEISRNAVYRVSEPGPSAFNPDNAYLLSGEAPPVKPHAFHSPENADKPCVVIRLEKPSTVRYLRIVNRTNGFHERAEGLTVWASQDESDWKQLWQAEKVAAAWLVDLEDDIRCRFLKIALPRKGTLHLNQVVVYGTP
jgi:hypothetical protein